MRHLAKVRNLAFLLMVGTILVVGRTVVSASCSSLGGPYDCDCSGDDFDWSIVCDLSEAEDPEAEGTDILWEAWDECEQECASDDYLDHLRWELNVPWADDECFITWAHVGGTAGPTTEASCSCQFFFICEP